MKTTIKSLTIITLVASTLSFNVARANFNHGKGNGPAIDFLQGHSTLTVHQGTTQSLNLGGEYSIGRMLIQAYSTKRQGVLNVLVNGVIKETLDVPMSDPTFTLDIYDTVSSIEFISHSGNIKIQKVIAYTQNGRQGGRSSHGYISGDGYAIAESLMFLMEELQDYTDFDTFKHVLFPIKVEAGKVTVMISAKGEGAKQSIKAIESLIDHINSAIPQIRKMMERESMFEAALDILNAKTQLEEIIY